MGPCARQRQTCKAWGQKENHKANNAADWGDGSFTSERRDMRQQWTQWMVVVMSAQRTQGIQQVLGHCCFQYNPDPTALPAASSPNNHDGIGRKGIAPQLKAGQAHILCAAAQVACHSLQELQLFNASSLQCTKQGASICMQGSASLHQTCRSCLEGQHWKRRRA